MAAGATLGTIVVAAVTATLNQIVGPVTLLVLSAILLKAAVRCLRCIAPVHPRGAQFRGEVMAIGGTVFTSISWIIRSSYLANNCIYTPLFSMASTTLHFDTGVFGFMMNLLYGLECDLSVNRRRSRNWRPDEKVWWLAQVLSPVETRQTVPLAQRAIDMGGRNKDGVGPDDARVAHNDIHMSIGVASHDCIVLASSQIDAIQLIGRETVCHHLFSMIHHASGKYCIGCIKVCEQICGDAV